MWNGVCEGCHDSRTACVEIGGWEDENDKEMSLGTEEELSLGCKIPVSATLMGHSMHACV